MKHKYVLGFFFNMEIGLRRFRDFTVGTQVPERQPSVKARQKFQSHETADGFTDEVAPFENLPNIEALLLLCHKF